MLALCVAAGLGPSGAAARDAPSDRAPAPAQELARGLSEALRLPELAEILAAEGIANARALREELFPDAAASEWLADAERIYDPAPMAAAFERHLARAIAAEDPAPVAAALAFLQGELGRKAIGLELLARRALLDEATEAMSRERVEELEAVGDARLAAVDRFIAVNDFIESNVVGGLNAHYAFYMGLIEGGAIPEGIAEAEILADVWAQEEFLREDNTAWLRAYFLLAYDPLTDADLEAFTEFSSSPAGRALNRVLFAAFDALFVDVSRALGLAAARHLGGTDL